MYFSWSQFFIVNILERDRERESGVKEGGRKKGVVKKMYYEQLIILEKKTL